MLFLDISHFILQKGSTLSILNFEPSAKAMINGVEFSKSQLFKFPMSREGLEWFGSMSEMQQAYAILFQQLYGQNQSIKWFLVEVTHTNSLNPVTIKYSKKYKKNIQQLWKIRCKVCTNTIIYGCLEGLQGYYLLNISYYHLHTEDPGKYIRFIKGNYNFAQVLNSLASSAELEQQKPSNHGNQQELINFYNQISNKLDIITKFNVMEKSFGINREYFDKIVAKVGSLYENEFEEMIRKFDSLNIDYQFIPKDLLNDSDPLPLKSHPLYQKDPQNPKLPNILIISTPEMKEQFRQFGCLVGFDLTFSVIKQRARNDGEYMMGVFASTNFYKKIVVFALVITNSQTVFAYAYIFRTFFAMMGSVPDVIVTDQEKAMHQALIQLQKEGVFKGSHLFDVFHILRKFKRGSSQSTTSKLIGKLVHSKNKLEYRQLFKVALRQIVNDKELETLRSFDLNSDYYCYSQINPKYVGIGVSNSPNEFFHHLIKCDIPYATNFTKAVQIVIDLIQKRNNFAQFPALPKCYLQMFGINFMNDIKKVVTDKAFEYMIKETGKGPTLRILGTSQEIRYNLIKESQEQGTFLAKDHYYLQDGTNIYYVYKKLNVDNLGGRPSQVKWSCLCALEERAGYLCCHIFKVLQLLGQGLKGNISRRWMIQSSQFEKIAFLQEVAFLKLNRTYQRKIYCDHASKISMRTEVFVTGSSKKNKANASK